MHTAQCACALSSLELSRARCGLRPFHNHRTRRNKTRLVRTAATVAYDTAGYEAERNTSLGGRLSHDVPSPPVPSCESGFRCISTLWQLSTAAYGFASLTLIKSSSLLTTLDAGVFHFGTSPVIRFRYMFAARWSKNALGDRNHTERRSYHSEHCTGRFRDSGVNQVDQGHI